MKNIAKRLKSYRAERAERRFKKRHSDYGVYFPLREDSPLLRRSTHTRVAQYLSLEDIKTVVRYTSHYIPLTRGYTSIMCKENLPGWYGLYARQALNAAGVISMDGPKTCYEEGVIGVVLLPDGSVLKDFGDLTHDAKTDHKGFRMTGKPMFRPFDYVVSEESCVLIHVPHGSEVLPALSAWGVREGVSVTDLSAEEQACEAKIMCDTGCLELVREIREEDLSSVSLFAARFSRVWLDVERFLESELEEMNTIGMGVIYERTSDGKPLRESWTDAVRKEVFGHYDTYHEEFKRVALGISTRRGVCVIIDLHSYNKEPLPYELRQDANRPELCVGTDDRATPPWLFELVLSSFDGVCETELNTPFSGTFAPSGVELSETPVVSVILEFRKDVLNDQTRTASIKDAILRLTYALNERCDPQASSSSDETVEVQKENKMEDNNMVKKIAETTDSDFTAYIEDGVFRITPPEAGISIFAALSGHAEQLQDAWDATDELVLKLEEVREEADKLRDYLESLQLYLAAMGCDDKVSEIDHLLWPVVGVLEDGTEVQFQYDLFDPNPAKCTYCVQGLTCSCEADIKCDYCSQGFFCDCGGAE